MDPSMNNLPNHDSDTTKNKVEETWLFERKISQWEGKGEEID